MVRLLILASIWTSIANLFIPHTATTIACGGSLSEVQACVNSAQPTDTVAMPNGTFPWAGTLTVPKNIIIKGNSTVANPHAADCPSGPNCGVVNNTVVVDNQTQKLINLTSPDATVGPRITGISFMPSATNAQSASVIENHTRAPLRVDHCYFGDINVVANLIWNNQYNYGVFDHNVSICEHGVIQNGPGRDSDEGDSAFEEPVGFGGPKFFFIEDNWLKHGGDIVWGGKTCARYNELWGDTSLHGTEVVGAVFVCHGTGRQGNGRGGRAYEVYGCNFHWNTPNKSMDGSDTGAAYWHDNTFTNRNQPIGGISLNCYRSGLPNQSPYYTVNGTPGQTWDYMATEANGTHIDGHSTFVFYSGTSTSGTGGGSIVLSGSPGWTANQWVGYAARRSDGQSAGITSNTGNTLQTFGVGFPMGWASGQTIEIVKPLRYLDQTGVGWGDHINRASPAWAHQDAHPEPLYSFNNINLDNGQHVNYERPEYEKFMVVQDRDYFQDTQLPGYVPYTYPHPLVAASGTPSPTPTPTSTPTPTPTPQQACGVFDLNGEGNDFPSSIVNNPNIDGVTISNHWFNVAPTATNGIPNYDWTYLDNAVNTVGAAGKKISIRISTGGGDASQPNGYVPQWVTAKIVANGGAFFTYLDGTDGTRNIPVFWDTTFLAEKARLYNDVGAHFANSPYRNQIVYFYVAFANAQTMDWGIPDGTAVDGYPPTGSTETTRWQSLAGGASNFDGLVINAGNTLITSAQTAFPAATYRNLRIVFSSAQGGKNIDPSNPGIPGCPACVGTYIPLTVFKNAKASYPDRIEMHDHSLSQKVAANQPFTGQPTNNRYRAIYEARPNVGAQMVSATQDMTRFAVTGYTGNRGDAMREAVQSGYDYGCLSQEIYRVDILASVEGLPEAIAFAHNLLTSPPTTSPTPTATATSTPTPTATATNTPTPTATATFTPTPTATATFTPTPRHPRHLYTDSNGTPFTPTATATYTPTPTATATNTPTPTATATFTPTPTATATFTPTPTATIVPSPTPTATFTPTPTPTPSATATPTVPPSPSPTPTATIVPSPTPTPTNTPTPTATSTVTPTATTTADPNSHPEVQSQTNSHSARHPSAGKSTLVQIKFALICSNNLTPMAK
jgi:hypothetical protein